MRKLSVTVVMPERWVQPLLERFWERHDHAWWLMSDRGSCYLPQPNIETLKFDDLASWELTNVELVRAISRSVDTDPFDRIDLELDRRDYDILGVTVAHAEVGSGLTVDSIFGHEAGMLRVAAWLRRWVDFMEGNGT